VDDTSKLQVRQKGKKFKNEDLPASCYDGNRWCKVFILTYIWFVAFQENPWSINDEKAVKGMQKIWDVIYGNFILHRIIIDDPVFTIVRSSEICFTYLLLLLLFIG
jgi:hypothetical protein